MSPRGPRMPLYEVMRSGSRRNAAPRAPVAAEGEGDVRFGGVIRLPTGVLLLAVAAVLFSLVVAYSVGYSRATGDADRRIEQLLLEQRADLDDGVFAATGQPRGRPGGQGRDGANATDAGGGSTPAGDRRTAGTRPNGRTRGVDPAVPPATGTPRGSRAAGGPETEATAQDPPLEGLEWRRPRVQWWDEYVLDPINTTPGPWYWLLMTTSREGAERFIEFARSQGLETYAVPVNNARSASYRVYVVPGLHTNSPDHEWHAPMRDFIRRVGEEWARQPGSGGDRLDSAYLHFFG